MAPGAALQLTWAAADETQRHISQPPLHCSRTLFEFEIVRGKNNINSHFVREIWNYANPSPKIGKKISKLVMNYASLQECAPRIKCDQIVLTAH
jgi:hypothetical protein